jgi:hypothetical protein
MSAIVVRDIGYTVSVEVVGDHRPGCGDRFYIGPEAASLFRED